MLVFGMTIIRKKSPRSRSRSAASGLRALCSPYPPLSFYFLEPNQQQLGMLTKYKGIHLLVPFLLLASCSLSSLAFSAPNLFVRPNAKVMLANRPSAAGRSPNSNGRPAPCSGGCAHVSNPNRKIGVLFSTATSFSDDDDNLPKKSGGGKWDEWKETAGRRLLKISNIASILCVIDCTVLPAVTIFLPILGIAASAEQAKWLHEIGHSIALWFVMPVGGLAATMNYISHKRAKLSAMAALGLTLIYAANGHGGPILSRLPHHLAHNLHCGTWLHRATNLLGCACLLGSNYLSHKLGGCSHNHIGGSCSHDH